MLRLVLKISDVRCQIRKYLFRQSIEYKRDLGAMKNFIFKKKLLISLKFYLCGTKEIIKNLSIHTKPPNLFSADA